MKLVIVQCPETGSFGVVNTTEYMPEPIWFDSEEDAKAFIDKGGK